MSGAPAIAVERLAKVFGGLRAVDDVSLSVEAGERRVLIGPNGAGKTTLFHCIAGTQQATHGSVWMFGTNITTLAEHRRTGLGMGRTFQISNVCTDLTVMENLTLAMLGTDRRKWVMYKSARVFAGLRDRGSAELSRVGLQGRADETVKFLSYGERRQLELALALASNPKVVLLDEPCAGLSPSERQRFSGLIRELPRDITLVMIEHDIDIALALADRVTVLHRGNIIFEGTPGKVQTNAQVREVYFGRV
ncbi:MAG: branched-chain amino acid transport system ATP-binding protein [Hyphomicrobiales bacterium]|nr:branched-chain amino acid transport system ATP-binding protein [Hyphomicrobiales bacterium]